MVPYIYIKPIKLFGFVPIQPFGILVGIGIVLGYYLARRRARRVGLDPDVVGDAIVWTIFSGFVVGHLVSVIFYFPQRVADNPLVLLAVWQGLSSFGGVMGGILGCWLFFKRRGEPVLPFVDVMIFGTIPGWIFGRAGCAVVHDHPGKVTDFFLAVHCDDKCYGQWSPGVTRHDLGLYEMFYLMFMTIVLYALRNVRPFRGFHPAVMLLIYAPARFGFDYLRVVDKRYAGLTPGQYFAVGMVILAIYLILNGLRLRKQGITPEKDEEQRRAAARKARSGKGARKSA